MAWKHISTAPDDGTECMVSYKLPELGVWHIVFASRKGEDGLWINTWDGEDLLFQPEYWDKPPMTPGEEIELNRRERAREQMIGDESIFADYRAAHGRA